MANAEFFANNLSLISDQPDLNQDNNNASIIVAMNPADLGVTQTASATGVVTGTQVTVTLSVANKGPATANNVVLTDSQQGGGTMASATPSQGSCGAPSGGQVTCTLGTLATSATGTVTIPITFTDVGQWTNSVSVSANEPDVDGSNNPANLNFNVAQAPDFTVSPASTSLTVQRGAAGTDVLTITSLGSFSSAVSLACSVSGPAPLPSCSMIVPLRIAAKKKRDFDPKKFLATIGEGRKVVSCSKETNNLRSGGAVTQCSISRTGKVRLTVVSENGKEATIGILNQGDFFGEGGLAGQPLRMGSATAMTDCELMRIDKKAMMLALHQEHTLSDLFTAYLLGRNIRYEADLVDQLFNSSEKRLARVLLLLAHFGKEGVPETVVPKISQETLAEMVGTTRSRVSFFMNRFRTLGFVDYTAGAGCKFIVHF